MEETRNVTGVGWTGGVKETSWERCK